MTQTQRHQRPATAIGRSFDVYYRDTARTARMDQLNAAFVGPEDLVFDIGAHVGDRTGSFLRLGARVVALEPQPRVFRALRLLYGGCNRAILCPLAAGASPGEVAFHVNTANPTVSSAATAFLQAARGATRWADQTWDQQIQVPVTTLDDLIARYGQPAFVKIDVEGYEDEVLKGLSTALPALSFEFTTIQRAVARACLARLQTLDNYVFNLSLGEDQRLHPGPWRSAGAMADHLDTLPDTANSGDIYACRVDQRRGNAG